MGMAEDCERFAVAIMIREEMLQKDDANGMLIEGNKQTKKRNSTQYSHEEINSMK